MKIAFVAPEMDPFVKVGGLADVVGSLPRALQALGHDVEVFLPRLGAIARERLAGETDDGVVDVAQPPLPARARLTRLEEGGVAVRLVGCPELFEREPLPYGDYDDNPARFAFFQLAALAALARDGAPDAIHLHDWPTGLLPVYRRLRYGDHALARSGIVFTIHNVAYVGAFTRAWMPPLGLPASLYHLEQLELYGAASALKAGILWSTLVTTVSPTYAREVQTPQLGAGLDGLLRKRSVDLVGVLNGIDPDVWDPSDRCAPSRRDLFATYSPDDLAGKAANRAELRRSLGLRGPGAGPLLGFVGRLDSQKGIAALAEAAPFAIERGAELVALGDGHPGLRAALGALAARFPGRVSATFQFDAVLARRIYAASDFFVMPSKYEPCGLGQLIACRFGAVPIVARTGGLADTVGDADAFPDGNGFTFGAPFSMREEDWRPGAVRGLVDALARASAAFADRTRYKAVQARAMACDFTWERSARRYVELYAEAARRERG